MKKYRYCPTWTDQRTQKRAASTAAPKQLLLCSDGLTGMVAEDEIERIMADGGSEHIVNCLVDKALENGGRDNTTVMVLCCEEKKSLIGRLFGK